MRHLSSYGVKVFLSIASWFFFSTLLSSVNKVLFGQKYNNFSFPLFVSSFHAILHFILAHITIFYLAPGQFPRFHSSDSDSPRVVSFRDKVFWWRVVPCGIAGGVEISTCNAALRFVSLSFYTIVKSTVPIWVLLFSFALGLEKLRFRLVLIIFIICIGVSLASISDVKFQMLGFILILTGSVTSGFKWCITQILLQKDSLGLDHPVLTLYVVAPIMAMFMFVSSLFFEDIGAALGLLFGSDPGSVIENLSKEYYGFAMPSGALIIAGAFAAFFMTLSEFMLIQLTSTLTLSIAGISKEVLMIAISVGIFKDPFSPINYFGLAVSIVGISLYNYSKLTRSSEGYSTLPRPHGGDAESPLDPHKAPIDTLSHTNLHNLPNEHSLVSRSGHDPLSP